MTGLVGQRIVGGGTPRTSTLKEHWAVPQALDAVHTTDNDAPTGRTVPDGGLQFTVVPGGLTVGAGYVSTTEFEQVRSVMSGGQMMVGGWPWSFTVMVNWQVLLLPQRSSAVQVTGLT